MQAGAGGLFPFSFIIVHVSQLRVLGDCSLGPSQLSSLPPEVPPVTYTFLVVNTLDAGSGSEARV